MNKFFCTSNNINVNNRKRNCEIFLTGGERENGGILFLFLNRRAAPSSGHLLNHAKTINLTNLL